MRQKVDLLTIVGLGMLLMPLLTMWHEIGGHAALCAVQGGHAATIGAFYVECEGLPRWQEVIVACAGVSVNALLSLVAYALWKRAKSDRARLVLWLIWVSEAFVASGYFCFSGVSGFGDLGTDPGSGFAGAPMPALVRIAELAVGVSSYILLVRAGIRSLDAMLGTGQETAKARRTIAHGYYATAGASAVVVGLMNPVGMMIVIMSAAASSFGGLAGFISLGFANAKAGEARGFVIPRNWLVAVVGAAVLLGFAVVLGPSLRL